MAGQGKTDDRIIRRLTYAAIVVLLGLFILLVVSVVLDRDRSIDGTLIVAILVALLAMLGFKGIDLSGIGKRDP